MDKKRTVKKFKDKKCKECGKKYLVDRDNEEWCWYCGTTQEDSCNQST